MFPEIRLLSIISKLLKAEIEGEGIPVRGVPQGGILSPLLSNIVLNELDWWVSNQWETFKSNHPYKHNGSKVQALKKFNLKECYIIRYADDLKVLCRTRSQAIKMNYATKDTTHNIIRYRTWYSSQFMPNGIKQIYVSRKIRVTILLMAEKKYPKA
ncbi:reverse transcriptase domain-containing protein [Priestia megaterium]